MCRIKKIFSVHCVILCLSGFGQIKADPSCPEIYYLPENHDDVYNHTCPGSFGEHTVVTPTDESFCFDGFVVCNQCRYDKYWPQYNTLTKFKWVEQRRYLNPDLCGER